MQPVVLHLEPGVALEPGNLLALYCGALVLLVNPEYPEPSLCRAGNVRRDLLSWLWRLHSRSGGKLAFENARRNWVAVDYFEGNRQRAVSLKRTVTGHHGVKHHSERK